jgi:phosphohistidine phosphatase
MTDLIIWRHAEAEDINEADEDLHRALTKRGHKVARKMSKWLNDRLPEDTVVYSSPARRCLETADALNKDLKKSQRHAIEIADFLSTDSTVEAMLAQIANAARPQTVLLVGHQPQLGSLIAKLLDMRESACVVKKGAVWWLRQRESDGLLQTYLYAMQNPDD